MGTRTSLTIGGGLLQQNLRAYDAPGAARKAAFHRAGKAFLRQLAQALELRPEEYDLRSNLGGIAVSGEVILHTEGLYLWLEESCLRPGILVTARTCKGRKDYASGRNHDWTLSSLRDPLQQARFLATCRRLHEEGLALAA